MGVVEADTFSLLMVNILITIAVSD
jgi:hypothetical protein